MENRPILQDSADYQAWVGALKQRLTSLQLKAALAVNAALLEFYWALGADIVKKQQTATWGDGFLKQLSQDLMAEFPEVKGFSYRNLRAIRQWYVFYTTGDAIWQQPVAKLEQAYLQKLTQIPWGHNLVIVSKCESREEALYYVEQTIEFGWSRAVLTHQIESGLWQREGRAVANFERTLPSPQSELAQQTLEEPTIGILICKEKDRLVAEYALSDIHKPIGISEYQLTQSLPVEIRSSLPSIEEIEAELRRVSDE